MELYNIYHENKAKCCGCGYRYMNHYEIADSMSDLKEKLKQQNGRALCSDCFLEDGSVFVTPEELEIEVEE